MSKLTQDLNSVAGIVGSLGIGIADAQREMNRDYLEAVERIVVIAQSLLHKKAADKKVEPLNEAEKKFVTGLLNQLLPTRYQYTKTSLKVRMDLAQTLGVSASAGGGGSIGAVAINASFAMAYGSDYQAAAELQTTLDAVPAGADSHLFKDIMEQAAAQAATDLKLPERSKTDQGIIDTNNRIIKTLFGIEPEAINPLAK